MNSRMLETRSLSLRFGGLTAVDSLDMRIEKGEIRALIGPNGSGKTSLLNVLSNIYRASSGTVLFKGVSIAGLKPHSVAARGIGRTFQTLRLFSDLSVIENVMVGGHCRTHANVLSVVLHTPGMLAEERSLRKRAEEMLDAVGLAGTAALHARSLPAGQQRLVEVARALMTDPELLLLDEPTAGLNPAETDRVMHLIAGLRDRGMTLLLVEHKMKFVMTLADTITVLNFGRKIAEGSPSEVRTNRDVITAYLGTEQEYA